MKLYTRPRPLLAGQLRPGDQLALSAETGKPVAAELEYVEHDLRGKIVWTTVTDSTELRAKTDSAVTICHARGRVPVLVGRTMIAREVIELDPWTYVDRAGTNQRRPE